MQTALVVLGAYLLGSVSFAIVVSRLFALPDPRSMFLGMHYTLLKLPDTPLAPRPADPRVGYFTETVNDYTDDLQRTPKQRFVKRWRLEKKDPALAVSEETFAMESPRSGRRLSERSVVLDSGAFWS